MPAGPSCVSFSLLPGPLLLRFSRSFHTGDGAALSFILPKHNAQDARAGVGADHRPDGRKINVCIGEFPPYLPDQLAAVSGQSLCSMNTRRHSPGSPPVFSCSSRAVIVRLVPRAVRSITSSSPCAKTCSSGLICKTVPTTEAADETRPPCRRCPKISTVNHWQQHR